MPRINAASGGQNWTVTLDALSIGKAHMISGQIEKNIGFSVSLSALFRRAISIYYDHVINTCSKENQSEGAIKNEFFEICKAAGRDPEDVIKGFRKRTGRNPLSNDKKMTKNYRQTNESDAEKMTNAKER